MAAFGGNAIKYDLSAVVVSAGRSNRFKKSLEKSPAPLGVSRSKQFIEWNHKPLIVHTIEALKILRPAQIALVIHPDEKVLFDALIEKHFSEDQITLCYGGERRQDSVRNGLNVLAESERVFVHDGARPFLDSQFLLALNEKSKMSPALIPALPLVETLKEIDENGVVVKTHNRNRFVRIQTPQFFNFSLLKQVHQKLADSTLEFTDDAAMFEHLGLKVQTFEGSVQNIKVTVVEDINRVGI